MEKTVLESSQVKSHQPHFSSVVGLRHGESSFLHRVLLRCFNSADTNSSLGRRREPQIGYVTQMIVFKGRVAPDTETDPLTPAARVHVKYH